MRGLDRLIITAVAVLLIASIFGGGRGSWREAEAPPPPAVAPAPRLPSSPASNVADIIRREAQLPDLNAGRVGLIERNERRRGAQSLGTAWALGDGVWVSARHVAEDCDAIKWRDGGWTAPRFVFHDPDVDLLAFQSNRRAAPLPLATMPPGASAPAIAVGFPKGNAGVAQLQLAGILTMRYGDRGSAPFRTYYWNVERYPAGIKDGNLAGISGGPVIDRFGRTIGVAIYGNERRAALGAVSLSDLRRNAAAHATAGNAEARELTTLEGVGERLLRDGRVAIVYCRG